MAETQNVNLNETGHQQPYQPIPAFYRDEMSASTTKMISSWTVFGALTILAITLIVLISGMKMGDDKYWFVPFVLIPAIVSFFRAIAATLEQKKFIKHQHDQFDQPNMIIVRDYKRLQVGNINTHWFCGLTYVWCLFIFIALVVAATLYSAFEGLGQSNVGWNTFWDAFMGKSTIDLNGDVVSFKNPFNYIVHWTSGAEFFFIAFISLIIALFGTIFRHCASVILINKRLEAIEDFYGKEIISPEEIHAIKKSAMIRDGVLFFVCTIILIGFAIGFYLKVKNTTTLTGKR